MYEFKAPSLIVFCFVVLSCNRQKPSETDLLRNQQVKQEVGNYLQRNGHLQSGIYYLKSSTKLGWTSLEMSSIIYSSELADLKPCHYELISGELVLMKSDCHFDYKIESEELQRIEKSQLIDNLGPRYTINAAGDTMLSENIFYDPEVLHIRLVMNKVVSINSI